MENSEKNRKKCFACSRFRRYYTKGDYCFNRTEYGFCIRKHEMKEKHDTCEEWDRNSRTRYTDKDKAMKVLSETLWEIASIRQILQEAQKEEQKKMKTDKKIPSCQNCAYYRAFHNEGIWDFWEQKTGLCAKCEKIVSEKESCESWSPCQKIAATKQALNKAAKNIRILQKIYEKQ